MEAYDDYADRLKGLAAVIQSANALKKSKETAANLEVVKYLASLLSAAESEQREVAKAKAAAEKAQAIDQKKAETEAKQRDESAEEEAEGDHATKLLTTFQKLKSSKGLAYEFVVCEAKPIGLIVAKKITAQHNAQLVNLTGSKRFFPVGTCSCVEGKFQFNMEKPVTGLARRLQESIKGFTGGTSTKAVISDPPPTLSPGQAFYLQAATPAPLEIPDPTLRIRYYHQDHLGSSTAITDANGGLIQESAFYPFGTPRNDYRLRQVETKYQLTQKERDRETGLHYFETRFLASGLARFVTPDLKYACPDRLSAAEFSAYASVPQQFNLYAYVRNNPLKYIDPLGQDASRGKDDPEPPEAQSTSTLTLKRGKEEITVPITSFNFGVERQAAESCGGCPTYPAQ